MLFRQHNQHVYFFAFNKIINRIRHILILDDILDTGHTLATIVRQIGAQQPASVKTAVLLRKRGRQEEALEPDYCGFQIPDEFVIGYGLDYNEQYRNLPYIGVLKEEAIRRHAR